jgi:hypothetical protein
MPKKFYSEADIEDLVKRGIRSLVVDDGVVLTDLAYEKALRSGLQLVGDQSANPPAAPVRPYVEEHQVRQANQVTPATSSELHQRIRKAVIAKLGSQVDPALLDTIISRVLQNTGLK